MNRCPEPALQPPEYPLPPLRCCVCNRQMQALLELPYGQICRACLTDPTRSLDELSALLCAPVVAQEPTFSQGGTL